MFPAQPTPRKEDLLMESGEYWLSAEQRAAKLRGHLGVAAPAWAGVLPAEPGRKRS